MNDVNLLQERTKLRDRIPHIGLIPKLIRSLPISEISGISGNTEPILRREFCSRGQPIMRFLFILHENNHATRGMHVTLFPGDQIPRV